MVCMYVYVCICVCVTAFDDHCYDFQSEFLQAPSPFSFCPTLYDASKRSTLVRFARVLTFMRFILLLCINIRVSYPYAIFLLCFRIFCLLSFKFQAFIRAPVK